MGELTWYKRDPSAALAGMMELNLEQRGAYNTVLDLIYARDGNLPDDDVFLSRVCGCNARRWRRIKRELVVRGKLQIEGGKIKNGRATIEVERAITKRKTSSSNGKKGGRPAKVLPLIDESLNQPMPNQRASADEQSNENKGLKKASKSLESRVKKERKKTPSESKKEDARPKLGEPDAPETDRGSRWRKSEVPEPWKVWTKTNTPGVDVDLAEAKFCDYWQAKPGKDGRKVKWEPTWRNWCRNEQDNFGRSGSNGSSFDFESLR